MKKAFSSKEISRGYFSLPLKRRTISVQIPVKLLIKAGSQIEAGSSIEAGSLI